MLTDLMPEKLEFHLGDVVAKIMATRGITRLQMAEATGHRRNTIGDLIRGNKETEKNTVENVLRVLKITREEVDVLVAQMNGQTNVLKMPAPRTPGDYGRDYDKDQTKKEVMDYAKRIAHFPPEVQMAIFNIVRAFENALPRRRESS